MRWPWQKEKRESGGDFSDAVVRLIESQASGTAADASTTAGVEAASGALSRAFASAEVDGPAWVQDAVTPAVLAQVGRDLVRAGDSMHVIRAGGDGAVRLIPASSWHWEGSHDPATWTVPGDGLRTFNKHDLEPACRVRDFRPLGLFTGAALYRHRTSLVGFSVGAAALQCRAIVGRRSGRTHCPIAAGTARRRRRRR